MKGEALEFSKNRDEIKPIIERLQNTTDEESYSLRARVAFGLRSLVKSVRIAGTGTQHLSHPHYQSQDKQREHAWRFFEVAFKDGSLRLTKPSETGPLALRNQLVVTAQGVRILGEATQVLA
jgi:hypothetical protein